MNNQQPFTPPADLVREWNNSAEGTHFPPYGYSEYIAAKAAQWGADQEYEETCRWIEETCIPETLVEYKEARRPKVPTLQERTPDILEKNGDLSPEELDAIQTALENLSKQL